MTGTDSYQPLVSVIIPNYNHAPFLRKRIDSVLNQTYSNIEVILLDDKSTDNSREIIEAFRNHSKVVHIEYNDINSGSTFKQWQKGFNLAKGEWIWIAESDDVADFKFLEMLLSDQLKVDTGIRYCASILINENSEIIANSVVPSIIPNEVNNLTGFDFVRTYMIKENSIPNASAVIFKKNLVKKSILKSIESYKLNGDWMFWILLLMQTGIFFNSSPMNKFRVHTHNVRTKQSSNALLEYFIVADFLDQIGYRNEVSDRLRYIYNSRSLSALEKQKIISHFWKKKDFGQFIKLIVRR